MTIEVWVWHEPQFRHVFKSWEGPVGDHVDRIAKHTVFLGRTFVGKEYAGESTRSGTGKLAAALRVAHRFAPNGDVEARAGANPSGRKIGYAIWHHEPTGTHAGKAKYPITPRPPRQKMVFYWRKQGRVVAMSRVMHPGSAGQFYLTRALRIAMKSAH